MGGAVNINDQPALGEILKEVCEIYSKPYNEVLLHAYYRVLKAQSFEAISKAILRILSDESRRQLMPTAAEIKAIARHMEQSGDLQTYLPCQHQGCEALVSFPPAGPVTEASYFCPRHKPSHQPEWEPEKQYANRVTLEEKRAIFEQATPKARAFLRSIDLLARQMRDIPITPEEQAATDAEAMPLRARAFEGKAEGPGVHPGVFLNHPYLTNITVEQTERRRIVEEAGWTFHPSEGHWSRGSRTLTDEQIDRIPTLEVLQELVSRR
jgi:hypothetical protein